MHKLDCDIKHTHESPYCCAYDCLCKGKVLTEERVRGIVKEEVRSLLLDYGVIEGAAEDE